MSGALGSHSLGSFQISAIAAGGSVTAASGGPQPAPSTSRAMGGSTTSAGGEPLSAPSTSRAKAGEVTTAIGSGVQTESANGSLGVHSLGGFQISATASGGSETEASGSPNTAESTSRGISGTVTSADGGPKTAESTSRAFGGTVTPALGSPVDAESWRGSLGVHQLGSFQLSAIAASASSETSAEGSPTSAPSTSRALADAEATVAKGRSVHDGVLGSDELGDFELGDPRNSLTRSLGGTVTTGEGTPQEHTATLSLGLFTLGGASNIGEGVTTRTWSNASTTLAEGSGVEGIRFLEDWAVDDRIAPEVMEETRNWQELTLVWRANRSIVQDVLRPLDDQTGKVELVEYPDGSYRVISRASEANKTKLTAPTERADLRKVTDYYVEEYDERLEDQSADIFRVEVNFIAEEPKEP